MNCTHCVTGLVLRDRQDGDLVCMTCNRSPAGTRAPLPEEALRKRGQRTGPRITMEASQHYGDALGDERRCSAVTELGSRCRNPAKVAGRCSTPGHRAVEVMG
jgi:hypothetical protein